MTRPQCQMVSTKTKVLSRLQREMKQAPACNNKANTYVKVADTCFESDDRGYRHLFRSF